MAEVVDVEEDHAERALHALHAVGLAEEQGEHGLAIVDAGEAVGLGGQHSGLAERLEFAGQTAGAQQQVNAQPPIRAFGGAENQVVDHSLGQPVDPLLGDSVRNQDNRHVPGCYMCAG